MNPEEYVDKIERFTSLWREKIISDYELAENIDSLTKSLAYSNGWDMIHNYMDPPKARP